MNSNVELTHPGWISNQERTLYYWTDTDTPRIPDAVEHHYLNHNDLAGLLGSWALVDLRGEVPLLVSDPTMSRPLYYAKADGEWTIADDIGAFRASLAWKTDTRQRDLFTHFGYSLGSGTLIEGVRVVQAGTQVELYPRRAKESIYLKYCFVEDREHDPLAFADKFSDAMDSVFSRLLDDYRRSQFVVPLSGGLDSRLLLTWLKRLGANNVLAFSYGRPGSEVAQAQAVADSLGFEFANLVYDDSIMHSNWYSSLGESFREYAWSGIALPHIQDWEAVRQLQAKSLIDERAVFLPGHTIVGNMHDEWLLESKSATRSLYTALATHHGNLQGQHQRVLNNKLFLYAFRQTLTNVCYDGKPDTVQAAIEWFNLRERQAKYINNSMRGYEFYGYRWALPMLDREMWDVWLRGGQTLTATRDWYTKFVKDAFSAAGRKRVELYDPRTIATKKYINTPVVQLLAHSQVGPLLANVRSAFIESQHPLAFDVFDPPQSRPARFLSRIGGTSRLGEWCNAFVKGTWGGDGGPIPRD